MDSIFIDPSSLPGGKQWIAACAAIESHRNATNPISHSLRCDASPIGGFLQVLFLLAVYGYVLYFVRFPRSIRQLTHSLILSLLEHYLMLCC